MTNFLKLLCDTFKTNLNSRFSLLKLQPRCYTIANYQKSSDKHPNPAQKFTALKSRCVQTPLLKCKLSTSNGIKSRPLFRTSGNSSKRTANTKVCKTSRQAKPATELHKEQSIIASRSYADQSTTNIYQKSIKTYEAVRKIIKTILQKSSSVTSFQIRDSLKFREAGSTDLIKMDALLGKKIIQEQLFKDKLFCKDPYCFSRNSSKIIDMDHALTKSKLIDNASLYSTSSCGRDDKESKCGKSSKKSSSAKSSCGSDDKKSKSGKSSKKSVCEQLYSKKCGDDDKKPKPDKKPKSDKSCKESVCANLFKKKSGGDDKKSKCGKSSKKSSSEKSSCGSDDKKSKSGKSVCEQLYSKKCGDDDKKPKPDKKPKSDKSCKESVCANLFKKKCGGDDRKPKSDKKSKSDSSCKQSKKGDSLPPLAPSKVKNLCEKYGKPSKSQKSKSKKGKSKAPCTGEATPEPEKRRHSCGLLPEDLNTED